MKIATAALRYNTNQMQCGRRHEDLYELLYHIYGQLPNNIEEGFVTDGGEFVDRYKAKEIAVAANQLIVPVEETEDELYSEDVW